MEALTEAAAVGERNAKLLAKSDNRTTKDATYYEARINWLEATIDAMQQMMASERKAVATVNAVGGQPDPGVPTSQRQQSYHNGCVASAPGPFRARGRGRGYHGTGGTWIARPSTGNRPPMGPAPRLPSSTQQQTHSMANQHGGQGTTGATPPALQQDVTAPTFQQQQQNNRAIWCGNCGWSHQPGHCRVAGFTCWNCAGVGHVQSCCPYLNTTPPPSQH